MKSPVVHFLKRIASSARDLAPIAVVIACFQLFILKQPIPNMDEIVIGSILVVVGLTFFIYGLEMCLFPIGESMAFAFARKGSVFWLLVFAFWLGFGTTVAEPALIAVSKKAARIAAQGGVIETTDMAIKRYAQGLKFTVAFAVGLAATIGVLRIIKDWSIQWIIMGGYVLVVLMTIIAPKEIIGIAYDFGGVTTSTITVPLMTALGIGLASSIKGRNPMLDGFGLIALSSLTPIIFVMMYGMLY